MAVLARLRHRLHSVGHRPAIPCPADDAVEELDSMSGEESSHQQRPQRSLLNLTLLHPSSASSNSSPRWKSVSSPAVNVSPPSPPPSIPSLPDLPDMGDLVQLRQGNRYQQPSNKPVKTPARTRAQEDSTARSLQDDSNTASAPTWFPPIEPYDKGTLRVSDLHELYWEWSGNPQGTPAVLLPSTLGAGCSTEDRRWLDPTYYRIMCLDPRGSGRSLPLGETKENTTTFLVSDLERVRKYFHLDRWLVLGHGWGSTLALAYAQAYPTCVLALVLSGIYTARPSEQAFWLHGKGTAHLSPDVWEPFCSFVPPEERSDLLQAYRVRLASPDHQVRAEAALVWMSYQQTASNFDFDGQQNVHPSTIPRITKDQLASAQIQVHFITNNYFLLDPSQLLLDPTMVSRIRHLPAFIVQGRYDVLCPPSTAWQLHQLWPEARFAIVPDAGHNRSHPEMRGAIVHATNLFKGLTPGPGTFSARSRGPSSHAHAATAAAAAAAAAVAARSTAFLTSSSSSSSLASKPSSGLMTPPLIASSSQSVGTSPTRRTTGKYSPLRVTGNPGYRRPSFIRADATQRSATKPSSDTATRTMI